MRVFTGDIEMAKDPEFASEMERIKKDFSIESIVETGTHKGTGSTLALAQLGLPIDTIECNPIYWKEAQDNLSYYKNVTCHLGYSLPLSSMQDFIRNDKFYEDGKDLDIQVDNLNDPKKFYLEELGNEKLEENLLHKFAINPKKQLILLDSAGGVGKVEFDYLIYTLTMSHWMDGRKVLVLDDVTHVKHYRSVESLKIMGIPFFKAKSNRWGWALLKK